VSNYRLWFLMQRNTPVGVEAGGVFSRRVIYASDFVAATEIAQAMVGEKVYMDRWFLGELIRVLETSDEPDLAENIFCDGIDVWYRVLEKLGLAREDVEFVRIAYTVHCEKHSEIVGFKRRAA